MFAVQFDRGHFGGQDAGGAVERGKRLVEHGHVSADARVAFDQDHVLAGLGQRQGRLDPRDAAAHHQRPGDDLHELPLQWLVQGHAADGGRQMGLGLGEGRGPVIRHPGNLFANVGHVDQEAVQAGILGRAAKGWLVQVRANRPPPRSGSG